MIPLDDKRVCSYCDITEGQYRLLRTQKDQPLTLTRDHIDPNNPTLKQNNAWACNRCNLVKNHTFNFEEMREIGQLYIRPMWRRIAAKKVEDLELIKQFTNEQ